MTEIRRLVIVGAVTVIVSVAAVMAMALAARATHDWWIYGDVDWCSYAPKNYRESCKDAVPYRYGERVPARWEPSRRANGVSIWTGAAGNYIHTVRADRTWTLPNCTGRDAGAGDCIVTLPSAEDEAWHE